MANFDDRQTGISESEDITLSLGVSTEDKELVKSTEEDPRVATETSVARYVSRSINHHSTLLL